jgi:hypothetical protein
VGSGRRVTAALDASLKVRQLFIYFKQKLNMTLAQATPSCVVHDEAWISHLDDLRVDTKTRNTENRLQRKPRLLLIAMD